MGPASSLQPGRAARTAQATILGFHQAGCQEGVTLEDADTRIKQTESQIAGLGTKATETNKPQYGQVTQSLKTR